ncbi:DUF3883 domain-containing protein [Ruegeria sp. Alg231-54]|uniref:DUF3883 domain-containing protein n=1 Tax=Ruegeria sp. Alg231-54 TaxID=1922221 RepID=UPI000D55E9B7|nr:DUF3883 domain-containing protein [Ruegeria sp. Alg231-54]
MLDVSNAATYQIALNELVQHKSAAGGRTYKGRFAQIFFGLKFYQNETPSIFSGMFTPTEILQARLDLLYSKASQPANDSVLMLFEGSYLARTGLIPPGRKYPSNIWRNNFNLQKGVGCYATAADLQSPSFLNQPREKCRYRIGQSCSLAPAGAEYRNESHRKWLRIDPGGNGYAVVDLQNIDNFAPYIAPNGSRIPIFPLISAIYHDSEEGLFSGKGAYVTVSDFLLDFNFTAAEADAYFIQDESNPSNMRVLATQDSIDSKIYSVGRHEVIHEEKTTIKNPRQNIRRRKLSDTIPEPILGGTPARPPQTSHGWAAEQFVAQAFRDASWEVHDVSGQRVGYDLLAKKGRRTIHVEVKSSVNQCSPSLTEREWFQAASLGNSYVLAIIENFKTEETNSVYWISDPAAKCRATRSVTTSYGVPRSSWVEHVQTLDDI